MGNTRFNKLQLKKNCQPNACAHKIKEITSRDIGFTLTYRAFRIYVECRRLT